MLGADSLWDLCLRLFGYSLWFNLLLHSLQQWCFMLGIVDKRFKLVCCNWIPFISFSELLLQNRSANNSILIPADGTSVQMESWYMVPNIEAKTYFTFTALRVTLTQNRTQNSAPFQYCSFANLAPND